MEYYMQQDNELNARLADVGFKVNGLSRWGCYWISLVNLITLFEGQVSRDRVVEVAKECLDNEWMDTEFYVSAPNSTIKALGGDRYYYIGFGEVRGSDNHPEAIGAIECWKDDRKTFKHFKLSFWDSYEKPGTRTNQNGFLHSYRVYGRKD